MARSALGDLVLVVREDQVAPAAVDVEAVAEIASCSWPSIRYASRAGRGPTGCPSPACRLAAASTARNPPGPLVGRDLDPRAGDQLVAAVARTARRNPASTARRTARGRRPRRRGPRRSARSIIAIISAICSVARGSTSGGSAPSAAMSSWNCFAVALGQRRGCRSPVSLARALILSSTSVMLRT